MQNNFFGRVLALDIGAVRIGAAISDPSRIIAQGLGVWKAENDEWRKDFDECIKKFPDEKDRFVVAEGENLPYEDNFFDKVICNGVFDACYQEQALQEMLRVCKVGGNILISGKNDLYYMDDEEAYTAEVNARKKEHPNYFTDVSNMLAQLGTICDVVEERYAKRRGDFGKNKFVEEIPDIFYEWEVILKKNKDMDENFSKFSDAYSKTWKSKNIKE